MVEKIRKFVKDQFIGQDLFFFGWEEDVNGDNARGNMSSFEGGVSEGERRREGEVGCGTVTEDQRARRDRPLGATGWR